MKRILLLLFAIALLPQSALAQSIGPKQMCIQAINSSGSTALIDAAVMTSSPSFSINRPNLDGGFDLFMLLIKLTDADTSITRFDLTCTASDDGNTTDYFIQDCTVAAGVATCVDAGVWRKASPGSKNWSYRLDVSGWPDIECTATVGTGAATATIDKLSVTGRFCTE